MRCAKTEPTSVAVVPLPPRDAPPRARRRAPARRRGPGSTAFAKRPTRERREDEREARVRRRDRLLDRRVPRRARATSTESRLSPIAATTHSQRDARERVVDEVPVGPAPDDQRRSRRASSGNGTSRPPAPSRFTRRPRRRSPRAAARCRPTRSSRAHARAPRGPSRRGAPRRESTSITASASASGSLGGTSVAASGIATAA